MTTKILIAEDHGIVRQGVRSLLERQRNFEVVAEVDNGAEALTLVRKFKPEVIIVDTSIPNFNVIDGLGQLLKEFPDMKVVALSKQLSDEFVKAMFEAGIYAYIFKDGLFEELIGAIETVLEGGIYLSPCITGVEINNYVKQHAGDSKL